MSLKTQNYELIKPELKDPADITSTNVNWDIIDENLKQVQDAVDNIGENFDFVFSEECTNVEGDPPVIDPVVQAFIEQSKVKDASELPYDETQSTKDKIDELNAKIIQLGDQVTFSLSGTTLTITTK